MDHKTLPLDAVDFKFVKGNAGVFSGYASVFGGVDAYGDTIVRGAYAQTLQNRARPVQMRRNHYGPVIGKWTRLEEDGKGLYVEGELTPGHSEARDTYALMVHGAVTGLSIGFRPVKSVENDTGGRDLHQIDLVEISVVDAPADLGAQIADVKAAIEQVAAWKDLEALLRASGTFSRSEATAIVARCKALAHGERAAAEAEAREAVRVAREVLGIK